MSLSTCPPPRYPEFAVIGRSNVGKSSLINMLTSRKDLALVSKQPGGYGYEVTRLQNFLALKQPNGSGHVPRVCVCCGAAWMCGTSSDDDSGWRG